MRVMCITKTCFVQCSCCTRISNYCHWFLQLLNQVSSAPCSTTDFLSYMFFLAHLYYSCLSPQINVTFRSIEGMHDALRFPSNYIHFPLIYGISHERLRHVARAEVIQLHACYLWMSPIPPLQLFVSPFVISPLLDDYPLVICAPMSATSLFVWVH